MSEGAIAGDFPRVPPEWLHYKLFKCSLAPSLLSSRRSRLLLNLIRTVFDEHDVIHLAAGFVLIRDVIALDGPQVDRFQLIGGDLAQGAVGEGFELFEAVGCLFKEGDDADLDVLAGHGAG